MKKRQAGVGDMMSSIERKSERFITSFADLDPVTAVAKWIANITGEGVGISPQPERLLKEMLRKARIGLIDWGNGKFQCPDVYDVLVSQEAWDAYYGLNTSMICRGLEQLHAEKVAEELRCPVDVMVRIELDHRLDPGEFEVKPSYRRGEDAGRDAAAQRGSQNVGRRESRNGVEDGSAVTVVMSERHRAPVYGADRTVVQGVAPTDVVDSAGVGDTPVRDVASMEWDDRGDEHTPSLAMPEATVSYCEVAFPIEDGATIGVVREGDTPQSTIALSYSEDLHFVSRKHGMFSRDGASGTWTYRQDGSNGSVLKRDKETIELSQGDVTTLEDGDELFMARAKRPVIFMDGSAQ
ncbi:DUF2662 domain-containing protein [Olsenella sp. SW781]|uniref:FhaA domain-containing protein n=1 Tax=Olsenella sp. SW781 TaxID=2530046 RepID=UPI00143A39C4|nr:FhaA domain-containing protein [Olsenella sp. SW781]NJE80426.1 DUF2662 domain-containing protein [Olsenella sp. SW781]